MRYLFERYEFDTDRRELRQGDAVVAVQPLTFDLLEYLIRNRDRVVSKEDIFNSLWGRRIVSDSSLTTRINAARAALGDNGEEQRLIRTFARKGLRFVGQVEEAHKVSAVPTTATKQNLNLNGRQDEAPRLSIVVLPFTNIGDEPEKDYFSDGVTESLTADLSRIAGLLVIARNTAFTFKGKAADIKRLGHELNVRYVLEGSVQRNNDKLRIIVQLADARTGAQLWAERFDKPIANLFDMQDEIVSQLANTLDARLTEEEARRSKRSPHPDSMDLYFQGKAVLYKGWAPEYLEAARSNFERALVLDSKNVEAMVWMAIVNLIFGLSHLWDDRSACLAAAEATVLRALSAAPNHAFAHTVLGAVLIGTNRAVQGIAECERALALDRNLAEAHARIGVAKVNMGRAAEAEAHMSEALRLSPRDIFAFNWLMMIGFAKLQLAADVEAVNWLRRSIEANRNYPLAHFMLAAALALLGSQEEAKLAADIGLSLDPGFTVRRFRLNAQSDNPDYLAKRERINQGLQTAGVPEG